MISVASSFLMFGARQDPNLAKDLGSWPEVLKFMSGFSLPILLIANFAQIMNGHGKYKNLLLTHGLAAAAIVGFSILLYNRYIAGNIRLISSEPDLAMEVFESRIRQSTVAGFFAFNMFIDLFLCTLTMYCLNARPKRFFVGKKLILLRLMVVLPIGYEAASLIFKYQSVFGRIA